MKTCALELEHVSAGYEQNRVIEDLSLAVAEGEMAALLGPNGAGKSTLLRTLTGLLKPLAGVVSLFGADVARMKAADRARLIAVVPVPWPTPRHTQPDRRPLRYDQFGWNP